MLPCIALIFSLAVALPATSARVARPRQGWAPQSGPPSEVFNNFGPNWGADQPWRAPPSTEQPGWGQPDNSDDSWGAPDNTGDSWGTPDNGGDSWGTPDNPGDSGDFPDPGQDQDQDQGDDSTEPPVTGQTLHLPPAGCNCLSTPQFNPVCGSDGNTYKNAGLLNCFRTCGTDVFQRRLGTCG